VELSQRTDLVECTLHTVETNLVEGGLLVVAGLRLLGNIRGGLIVAVAIPLSMLFAVTRMVAAGLSSNMPALVAALDFLS
jgi:cobalt-zinc-cadmium resistance protein CzcA